MEPDMSLSLTQCEPVLIFYDSERTDLLPLFFSTPDNVEIGTVWVPKGSGYLDWVCIIPAGQSFLLAVDVQYYYYTVQPGPSSACLGSTDAQHKLTYKPSVYSTYTSHSYTANAATTWILTIPLYAFANLLPCL